MLVYEIRCLGCGRVIPEWKSTDLLPLCECGYSQRTIGPQYETLRPLQGRLIAFDPPALPTLPIPPPPPRGLAPAPRENAAPVVRELKSPLPLPPAPIDPAIRWRIARGLPPDGQEPVGRFRRQRVELTSTEDEKGPRVASPAAPGGRPGEEQRHRAAMAALGGGSLSDRIVEVDVVPPNPTPHVSAGFAFETYWPCGFAGLQAPSARIARSRRYEGYPHHAAYDRYIGAWR